MVFHMIKFENKKNGRYYYLVVNRDMFNHLVLTIIRGGKNSSFSRHFAYNSQPRIDEEIKKISKIRIKRGYSLISN